MQHQKLGFQALHLHPCITNSSNQQIFCTCYILYSTISAILQIIKFFNIIFDRPEKNICYSSPNQGDRSWGQELMSHQLHRRSLSGRLAEKRVKILQTQVTRVGNYPLKHQRNQPTNFNLVRVELRRHFFDGLKYDKGMMAVWMSFKNPTKFSSGMNVAQPPRKREERERASGILRAARREVWEFVDLVSGYPHKASCFAQIPKQLEMSVKYAD